MTAAAALRYAALAAALLIAARAPAQAPATPPAGAATGAGSDPAGFTMTATPGASNGGMEGYTPCLGCAEHEAMRTRWQRPFLVEMGVAGMAMVSHFQMENEARRLGLCESDVLMRSALAVAGCHAYSPRRAWLIEAPLEVVAFTSPAWGLERRGHPRWALLLEAVPISYHAWSAHATLQAIHQWRRLQYLYFGTPGPAAP